VHFTANSRKDIKAQKGHATTPTAGQKLRNVRKIEKTRECTVVKKHKK